MKQQKTMRAMKTKHYFFSALSGAVLIPTMVLAEAVTESAEKATDAEINTGADMKGQYDGWQMEYGGFRQSPILLDPRVDPEDFSSGRKRTYPPLNDLGLGKFKENNVISVDDEVQKTKLAIFQPISQSNTLNSEGLSIQSSFANNEQLRDNHLNLFRTVRAVAILTLSYLDKTVAAGLATTQQQVDNDTTHELLKQISWSTAKLANPDREQLFNDVDEKFEKCMLQYDGMPSAHLAHVHIDDAQSTCAPLLPSTPSSSGIYHYCICVAESAKTVNDSVTGRAGGGGLNQPFWSLVERVFFGLKVPMGAGGGTYTTDPIVDYTSFFGLLYGDLRLQSPAQGGVTETNKFEFIVPHWSVPNGIQYLRDALDEHTTCSENDPIFIYCPITGGVVDHGICPAFRQILQWGHEGQLEQMRTNNPGQLNEYWIEASLGGPITAADIKNVLKMRNDTNPNVELYSAQGIQNGTTNHKTLQKFVESFCDASAITAFKKMHVRGMSIALDHMALNRKATDRDKRMVNQLMSRVSQYLELGGIDSRSSVENMLLSVAIEADRKEEAARTAATASAINQVENANQLGEIGNFGGTMEPAPTP